MRVKGNVEFFCKMNVEQLQQWAQDLERRQAALVEREAAVRAWEAEHMVKHEEEQIVLNNRSSRSGGSSSSGSENGWRRWSIGAAQDDGLKSCDENDVHANDSVDDDAPDDDDAGCQTTVKLSELKRNYGVKKKKKKKKKKKA
jgi:hypothetical protein